MNSVLQTRKRTITIKCKESPEISRIITNIGKVTLQNDCKLITNDVIIKSESDTKTKIIKAYL